MLALMIRRLHSLASKSRLNLGGVVARSAILLFGVLAALVFWQVSGTLNAQPTATPFPGWLVVLQPSRTASSSQVQLQVQPLKPGAPGVHPSLSYSVAACGTRPFRGVLLIGGDARLSKPRMLAPAGTSLSSIANAEILDAGTGQLIPLGTVEALRFTLAPTRCVGRYPPEHAAAGFAGTAVEIAGLVSHSVQQAARFGLWDGPRSAQSWPLMGSPPGIAATDLGEWRVAGLPGSWSRPFEENIQLDGGSLTTVGSLEAARPSLVDVTRLSWESTSSFQASARVLNTNALSAWQDRLVAVTIVLALAGSLLAAALFDVVPPLRSTTRHPGEASITTGSGIGADMPSVMDHRRRTSAVATMLGALFVWVLTRRSHRRSGIRR